MPERMFRDPAVGAVDPPAAAAATACVRPALLAGAIAFAALLATGCAAVPGAAGSAAGPSANRGGVAQAPEPTRPRTAPAPRSRPGPAARAPEAAGDDALPSVELTSEIVFQVLAAEIAVQRGQLGPAAATLLRLAQQTGDPRLARRATEVALSDRALDRALQGARLWARLAPRSQQAQQTYEALLLGSGRLTEAEPRIVARLAQARRDGTLGDAYQQIQRALVRVPDRSAALAMLERVSAPDENDADARLALAVVAGAGEQFERAAAEAGAALRLRPDDENIAILAASFVQRTALGNDGAAALLRDYLRERPKAMDARLAYARLLANTGRPEQARTELETALRGDPANPQVLFTLAQVAYEMKQLDAAEGYLKRFVDLPRTVPRDNQPAFVFLAQIAEDRGRLQEAIGWLEQVSRGEQVLPATMRRALLLARLKRIDEARELLRTAPAGNERERTQLVSAEAQVLREAQRFREAFELLDAALARQPDNTDLLYDHGMAAERIDRIDVMERSMRRLIELKPDHAHAHNALGYTLADRNLRLDEARSLIVRALELLPDDPHILDSMGWVLYRQGDLDGALKYLQRAWDIKPEAEVAVHLGEVLWKLGRSAEARRFWQEARSREPDNEVLRETLARLNVAL